MTLTTITTPALRSTAIPQLPGVVSAPDPLRTVSAPVADIDDAEGDADGGADGAESEEETGFEDDDLGFEGSGFSPAELEEFDEADFDDDFDDDFEEDLDDDLDEKDEVIPAVDDDEDEFDDEELFQPESPAKPGAAEKPSAGKPGPTKPTPGKGPPAK